MLRAMFKDNEWMIKHGREVISRDKNLARAIVQTPLPAIQLIEFAKTVNDGIHDTVKKLLL